MNFIKEDAQSGAPSCLIKNESTLLWNQNDDRMKKISIFHESLYPYKRQTLNQSWA